MSKYSGAEKIASFAFVLFVLSFTILRVVYYPFWVLRSTRFVFFLSPIKIPSVAIVVANLGELYNVGGNHLVEVKKIPNVNLKDMISLLLFLIL
jgi:hypothetical protein